MAKFITALSNVWSEPQAMVYNMMFQSGSKKPKNTDIVKIETFNSVENFETSPSIETTEIIYKTPSVDSKLVQAGCGLRKNRNATIQCGVAFNKLQHKSVNYIDVNDKLDCRVGPSATNFKEDAQTNPLEYKICDAHREVFEILTNWQRDQDLRRSKKESKCFCEFIKTQLLNIGKAFVSEKIQIPPYYQPEQQVMKLYKCLSLKDVKRKKSSRSRKNTDNGKNNKSTRTMKTKTRCTYTQTNEIIYESHATQEGSNEK